jgi:hypothetical protein
MENEKTRCARGYAVKASREFSNSIGPYLFALLAAVVVVLLSVVALFRPSRWQTVMALVCSAAGFLAILLAQAFFQRAYEMLRDALKALASDYDNEVSLSEGRAAFFAAFPVDGTQVRAVLSEAERTINSLREAKITFYRGGLGYGDLGDEEPDLQKVQLMFRKREQDLHVKLIFAEQDFNRKRELARSHGFSYVFDDGLQTLASARQEQGLEHDVEGRNEPPGQ